MTSRRIPPHITEIVRKRCGFGCAICGFAIVEYHHFPPFSKIGKHEPDKITLLCPNHHTEADKNIISEEDIVYANRHPICKQKGFSYCSLLDGSSRKNIKMFLGKTLLTNCRTIFQIHDEPIFYISPPEVNFRQNLKTSKRWRISGKFYNREENLMCIIKNNLVEFRDSQVDIKQKNNYFCIKDNNNNDIFKLILESEGIRLATLKMKYKNNKIDVDGDIIKISSSQNAQLHLKCKHMKNFDVAFNMRKDGTIRSGE